MENTNRVLESDASTQEHALRLTVLGARGSMAVSGSCYSEFGCATSCYLVEADDEQIILDAGTGLLNAPHGDDRCTTIVLSHVHVDHLLGLGMFGRLSVPGATTRLYVPAHSDDEAMRGLSRLYSLPLWPVEIVEYAGDVQVRALPDVLRVGDVEIRSIEGNHPGGCRVFKVSRRGKSVVYATDYEYEPESFQRLVEFAKRADLVLFDGQYNEQELKKKRGFGHSTPAVGIELLKRSGAKRLWVVHHDPYSTDEELAERERNMECDAARFAREGDTIEL